MNQSVTVLMTTYNCAHYINLAIKSILIQTHKDFEFLIIDDGSIDETSVFVNQFKDKRIRYIKRNHFGRSASLKPYCLTKLDTSTIINSIEAMLN